MRTSWRSWFWNIILLVVTLLMGSISVAVTVEEIHRREPVGVAIFTGFSLWLAVLAARALWVGVYARPHGIVIRSPGLTRTIPWGEVTAITSGGPPTSSPSSALGATTIVVMRRRPGAAEEPIALNVIGRYGLTPIHPTPADRAIADLHAHLENWRNAQSVAD